MTCDEVKDIVARRAIDDLIGRKVIHDRVKIGMGTGSTATRAVYALKGAMDAGLVGDVLLTATSYDTALLLDSLGCRCYSMNDKVIGGSLDIVIDGADTVDSENRLIKGGGAALLQEKIAAYNSANYAILVDDTKIARDMGTRFPVPIEVVPPAMAVVVRALSPLGARATLRRGARKCGPVVTDNGNWILDALWDSPIYPASMEGRIKSITGVVEVGLFTHIRPTVYIGHIDGTVDIRS